MTVEEAIRLIEEYRQAKLAYTEAILTHQGQKGVPQPEMPFKPHIPWDIWVQTPEGMAYVQQTGAPGGAPTVPLFPEHGIGVPPLYSAPEPLTPEEWIVRVEEIIEVSEPSPSYVTLLEPPITPGMTEYAAGGQLSYTLEPPVPGPTPPGGWGYPFEVPGTPGTEVSMAAAGDNGFSLLMAALILL